MVSTLAILIAPFRLQATYVYLPENVPRAAVVQLLVVALKELLASPVRSLLKSLAAFVLLPMAGARFVRWPAFRVARLDLVIMVHRLTLPALLI